MFAEAACVQATCKEEMEYYRALGFKNPVAVLPNPIDINGVIDREIPKSQYSMLAILDGYTHANGWNG